MERIDGREINQLREIKFELNYVKYAEGSVLVSFGNTKVLCNVTIEEEVPHWMKSQSKPGGWVTAEYAMLPRSTHTRNNRETKGLKGRTQEISRLIGRSLRASVNLEALGQRSIIVDCDVIQADGGTRTAAITGGDVALRVALNNLIKKGEITNEVYRANVAAISVGIINDNLLLDLCYEEDVKADVDSNIVMNSDGSLIELQATAEGVPFSREQSNKLVDLAYEGLKDIFIKQQEVLAAI
jgi:ribonuclease PH